MPKGKRHSAQFKFQVALDAAKGTKTLNELASQYELHPSQISEWKSQLLKEGASVFSTTTTGSKRNMKRSRPIYMSKLGGSRWNWSG